MPWPVEFVAARPPDGPMDNGAHDRAATKLRAMGNMERVEAIVAGLPDAVRVDIEAWGGEPTFRVHGKNFVFSDPEATSLSVKLPARGGSCGGGQRPSGGTDRIRPRTPRVGVGEDRRADDPRPVAGDRGVDSDVVHPRRSKKAGAPGGTGHSGPPVAGSQPPTPTVVAYSGCPSLSRKSCEIWTPSRSNSSYSASVRLRMCLYTYSLSSPRPGAPRSHRSGGPVQRTA